ncbi:hypothetical protein JCM11491_006678 [Sporobolomyces phaffii]
MSGLLQRYSSYSSGGQASHHIRPSPAHPADSPPSDPFPPAPNSLKPSDVLINRSHQLKRFAKHLALYFQALAQSHHAHSLALQKLPAHIPTPIQEATIFLPSALPASDSPTPASDHVVPPLGGTGQEGWAQILQEIKDTNQRVSVAHQELAKRVTKDVVGPLNKSREAMKGFINAMEKDVNRLCDAVQRERDLTNPLFARLRAALDAQPLRPQLVDDPLVIRAQLEAQLSVQLQKENELLAAVKGWTDKTEIKEKELFAELAKCWKDWESTNSAMLLGNQQLSMFLSATVDSVPPESEWSHFLKLNHSIPPETPAKTLKDIEWEGKGDERCGILLEGALERQTSFLKSWKAAYFILTPTGHLLLYQPPTFSSASATARSRASTLSVPPPTHHSLSTSVPSSPSLATSSPDVVDSTALSSISPTAFHLLTTATPLVTLHLPTCSLGPMPTPDHDAATGEPIKKKKGGLDAAFTLIENEGKGTKHIMRAVPPTPAKEGEESHGGADEWETMGTWIKEISKFTLPCPPSPTLPSLPTSPSTVSLATVTTPPALPSRGAGSSSNSASSPPLPQLPSPPLGADAAPPVVPTPASMSIFGGFFGGGRSSVASTSTTSKSVATTADADADDGEEEEEDVDLGAGPGAGPPPLPPRDHHHPHDRSYSSTTTSSSSAFSRAHGDGDAVPIIEDQLDRDTDDDDDDGGRTADEDDRGDLGRSLSPPPPPRAVPAPPPPPPGPARTNSGRVANLAKAFDQEAATNARSASPTKSLTSPKLGGGASGRGGDSGAIEETAEEGEGRHDPGEETLEGGGGGNGKKSGKKNKKKNKGGRKSAGDEEPRIDAPARPSFDRDSSDLSLASPPLDLGNSRLGFGDDGDDDTAAADETNPFDLSLSHLRIDHEGDLSGVSGGGDMSFDEDKLEREYGAGERAEEAADEEPVTSPPPMVLEEAEEGPGHEQEGEEEHHREGEGGLEDRKD